MNLNENTRKGIMLGISHNKIRSDDYYTTRETVELHFRLIDKLIKKHNIDTFVLPCDTIESEYFKYLSENGNKVIYFQDMYNIELYPRENLEHTLVVTNPPFTGLTKWENWLLSNNFMFSILTGMTKNFQYRQNLYDTYLHLRYFNSNNQNQSQKQIYITNSKSFGEADYLPDTFNFNKTDKRIERGKKFYRGEIDGLKFYASYNGIYNEDIGANLLVPFSSWLIALENQGYIRIDKDYRYTPLQQEYFKRDWKRAKVTVLKHFD